MRKEVLAAKQGKHLAKMTRWFTLAEALAMATSANAALLALSGPRNPYPGTLGLIQEGRSPIFSSSMATRFRI